AIRLAEHGPFPTMLVCYSNGTRRWFARGSDVPEQVWPSKTIEPKTYAYDLLKSHAERDLRGEVPATAWFDYEIADGYYVHEHSLRIASGEVLSLLWWKEERMLIHLEEHEEAKAARRSDWREDE